MSGRNDLSLRFGRWGSVHSYNGRPEKWRFCASGTVKMKLSELCRDTQDFSNAASSKTGKNYDICFDWETEHTHVQKIPRVQEPAGRRELSHLNQLPFPPSKAPGSPQWWIPPKANQEDRLEKTKVFQQLIKSRLAQMDMCRVPMEQPTQLPLPSEPQLTYDSADSLAVQTKAHNSSHSCWLLTSKASTGATHQPGEIFQGRDRTSGIGL